MKLVDYVINFFASKGIDKMFIVYGAANAPLVDAFKRIKKQNILLQFMNKLEDLLQKDMQKQRKFQELQLPQVVQEV